MPFPQRQLHDDEQVVMERHPNSMILIPPALAMIATGALAIVLGFVIDLKGWKNTAATWVPVGLLAVSALWLAQVWLIRRSTMLVLTTDRLIHRYGLISKKLREIPLERINDISSGQSLWQRITRRGNLTIESGGEHGQVVFDQFGDPFEAQNQIYRQIERTQARDMDRMAGRRQLSVPEQIEKLDQLRQQGVVTQAEFDAKKAQLLEQM